MQRSPPPPVDHEHHNEKHALTNFMYYAVLFANYSKSEMINKQLTCHLFHFFFSHYHVLMLEFAIKLRSYRCKLNTDGYPYDERWEIMADDIILFLKIVGLLSELPRDHTYLYYPSLNGQGNTSPVMPDKSINKEKV